MTTIKKKFQESESDLVSRLFALVERKGLSIQKVSKMSGLSFRTLYRWRDRINVPEELSRREIKRLIRKLERLPEIYPRGILAEREIYRALKRDLTVSEKRYLLTTTSLKEYRKRLNDLKASRQEAQAVAEVESSEA